MVLLAVAGVGRRAAEGGTAKKTESKAAQKSEPAQLPRN